MPRISVVLPNYNYARYLPARIESLLRQTFGDFELIIIDDASTDDSRAVIERYGDPRIRTIFRQENSGHAYQRWNEAADTARGELILFAGADDYCDETMLARLLRPLDASRKTVLAYCDSALIDREGRRLGEFKDRTAFFDAVRWETDYLAAGTDEAKYLVLGNSVPTASGVLLRRDAFDAAGRFDLSYRVAADWRLWFDLAARGDFAYVRDPLNFFRTHADTVRSRIHMSVLLDETYRILESALARFEIPREDRERALDIHGQILARHLLSGNWGYESRAVVRRARGVDRDLYPRLVRVSLSLARGALSRRVRSMASS